MVLLPCTLSVSTFVALLLILPSVLATCYYPNGDVSQDDYIPCPNSEACCPKDAFCLSNGLCWTSLNFLFRASCSDQSWTSPDCPKYCLNANPYSGKVMTPCSAFGQFACDYDTCGKENFTVSKAKVVLRDYQQQSLGASVTATPNATTGASTSISTSSSTSTATLAKESANPVDSSSSNSSSNQSSKLAAVGAGVGVPLAIALVAALVLLVRERRKARRLELENARLGGNGGSNGPGMVGHGEPTAYHQQSAIKGYPNGGAAMNAELMEDRAQHEVMAQPIAHELHTHRG